MASRRAWNEAMKKAATGTGLKLPDHRRSSNRSKRREKARKATVSLTNNDPDGIEYRNALRLDFLEGAMVVDDEEVEEEYDELEDMEESHGGGGRKRKRSTAKRRKKTPVGAIPKRFKARSLASILIEESSRADDGGVTQKYLHAEARPMKGFPKYPKRKLCPVTGLEGVYTDPKSGIPYANLQALEQIRERVPPWISGAQGGSSAYHDAVKSLRNEE